MIIIQITRLDDGYLSHVSSKGHAPMVHGTSLACGIISASLKSFGITLAKNPFMKVEAKSDGPGDLEITLGVVPKNQQNWFRGVQDSFLQTLEICQIEFTEQIQIIWKDQNDGSFES